VNARLTETIFSSLSVIMMASLVLSMALAATSSCDLRVSSRSSRMAIWRSMSLKPSIRAPTSSSPTLSTLSL